MGRKKGFATEAYQLFFTEVLGEQALEDHLRASRHKLLGYRATTYWCGENVVEVKLFPLIEARADISAIKREAEQERHRLAQQRLNRKNAEQRFRRLMDTNFTAKDLFITLTYAGDAPDYEQARKDIINFLKRVRRWMRRQGITEPLRYMYVIEHEDDPEKQQRRVHHHVVITGIDRDVVEGLWTAGRANTRRLQPDDHGLAGLAKYMSKDPKGKKRWGASLGLKQPKVTVSDRKISRRKAEQLALQFDEVSREVLERAYPGYRLVACEVKTSKYVPGAYINARLIRDPARKRGRP